VETTRRATQATEVGRPMEFVVRFEDVMILALSSGRWIYP